MKVPSNKHHHVHNSVDLGSSSLHLYAIFPFIGLGIYTKQRYSRNKFNRHPADLSVDQPDPAYVDQVDRLSY